MGERWARTPSTTRGRWLSPRDFVSLSPRPSRREREGRTSSPPPCPPPALVSLVDTKGRVDSRTHRLFGFFHRFASPLDCPLSFHDDDDDEHNGTQEQHQAPDKERPFRGPSHLPLPPTWPLCWPGLAVCRCHSATPSPTGRLFPSRVAGLYWQNEPSSYQRRHLPVALPSPTHTPLIKVQRPHCHPPRQLAHTPMQHASGEPRTKTHQDHVPAAVSVVVAAAIQNHHRPPAPRPPILEPFLPASSSWTLPSPYTTHTSLLLRA